MDNSFSIYFLIGMSNLKTHAIFVFLYLCYIYYSSLFLTSVSLFNVSITSFPFLRNVLQVRPMKRSAKFVTLHLIRLQFLVTMELFLLVE